MKFTRAVYEVNVCSLWSSRGLSMEFTRAVYGVQEGMQSVEFLINDQSPLVLAMFNIFLIKPLLDNVVAQISTKLSNGPHI